jgi:hypothetical protein
MYRTSASSSRSVPVRFRIRKICSHPEPTTPAACRVGNGDTHQFCSGPRVGVLGMRTIHLSTDTRTKMARTLAKFLKEREQVEIKHSVANQAVAALLGMNEHSLAAAIRRPGGVELVIDEPGAPRISDPATSTKSAPVPDYQECLKRVI